MTEPRFRPLTAEEQRAIDESPDIATAIEVNGIAFHVTGETYTIDGIPGVLHVATIARRCNTDDLARLHGADVPGVGVVRRVERFVTMTQSPGMKIGLLVDRVEEPIFFHLRPPSEGVRAAVARFNPPIYSIDHQNLGERIGERDEAIDRWALALLSAHGVSVEDAPRRSQLLVNRTDREPGAWIEEMRLEIDGKVVGEPLVFEMAVVVDDGSN